MKQEKKTQQLLKLKADKASILADTDKFFANKIKEYDDLIQSMPDSKPIRTGNITMKQHLKNIKKEIMDDKQKFINKTLKGFDNAITEVENTEVEEDGS